VSLRLEAATEVVAPVTRVWDELVDWSGQSRWIPMTTVRIVSDHQAGVGVRAVALSGYWLGPLPLGLLDRFVVTGWTPPGPGADGHPLAELEVRHLGPYFTGAGVFALRGHETGTTVTCVETFDLPAGRLLNPAGRLLLPVLRRGFRVSLKRFAAVCGPV
jgi:hypothetical protein